MNNSLDLHLLSEQVKLLSERWLPLQFQISDERDSLKTGLSLEDAFRKLVLPAFDLLLGEGVARAALGGRIDFMPPNRNKPPFTIDLGRDVNPKIHLFWRGSSEDVLWLAHEFAHAVQIRLSDHGTMPPIAREVCAFLGELALINYARSSNAWLAKRLQKQWWKHSCAYLSADFTELSKVLSKGIGSYHYRMNYPLARLCSIYLYPALTQADVVALFRSGPRAITHIRLDESLSHFDHSAQNLTQRMSREAAGQVLLGQIERSWLGPKPALKVLSSDGVLRSKDTIPAGSDKWRSLGVIVLGELTRGEAVHRPPRSDFQSHCEGPGGTQLTATGHNTFDGLAAVGLAVHHLTRSKYHSNFALLDYLAVEILPALACDQIYFFVNEEGLPIGLITWARVSDDVAAELETIGRSLRTDEWTSGPQLFVNDLITENGALREIIKGLRGAFSDTTVTATRRNRDGSIRKASKFNRKIGPHFDPHSPSKSLISLS